MKKTLLISIISLFLFTGCISLTNNIPSYNTFFLNIEESKEKNKNKQTNKTILIKEPKTVANYNSKNIFYSQDNLSLESYAFSKWINKPTKMLQNNISKKLNDSNIFKYASTINLNSNVDYVLVSELVDFKHTFENNNSYANFTINVFIKDSNNEAIYNKTFTYKEKSLTNDAKGFVQAINKATNSFYSELEKFISNTIS